MKDEIAADMRAAFTDRVEIPAPYEYIPQDALDEVVDGTLDGYAFEGKEHVIFVDCRGLPEQFFITVLEAGAGEVETAETHLSREAAEQTTAFMEKYA